MSKSAILMGENLTYVKMNKMYFKKKTSLDWTPAMHELNQESLKFNRQ